MTKKTDKKMISLTVEPLVYKMIDDECKKHGSTRSTVVRRALEMYLCKPTPIAND